MNMRKFWKGILLATLGNLLVISVLLAANASIFSLVTSNASKVKSIVADSGIYKNIGPVAAETVAKDQTKQATDVPLDDAELQKLFASSIDEDFAKTSTENVIDGTYSWLNGSAAQPDFAIDITPVIRKFSAQTNSYVLKRSKSLPVCSIAQLQNAQVDIFTTKCRPPGITDAQIKKEVDSTINKWESLPDNNTLTASSIKNDRGQSIAEQYSSLPNTFRVARLLPLLFLAIAAIAAILILKLSLDLPSGLKRVGWLLLLAGILLVLVPEIANYTTEKALGTSNEPMIEKVAQPLVQTFNERTSGIYFNFGVATLTIGIIMMGAGWYISRPARSETEAGADEESSAGDNTGEETTPDKIDKSNR